jgi:hypothetical protein
MLLLTLLCLAYFVVIGLWPFTDTFIRPVVPQVAISLYLYDTFISDLIA